MAGTDSVQVDLNEPPPSDLEVLNKLIHVLSSACYRDGPIEPDQLPKLKHLVNLLSEEVIDTEQGLRRMGAAVLRREMAGLPRQEGLPAHGPAWPLRVSTSLHSDISMGWPVLFKKVS